MSQEPPDLHALPDDLPVPEDDGAADHLADTAVPSVVLPATGGEQVNLAIAAAGDCCLVVYVYPRTGVPGRSLPTGWDRIPGARGCTPQSCAFRDSAGELAELGATVFGLSAQRLGEQREFAARENLPYPLLNDAEFRLAEELGLPTFVANGIRHYRRLTFVARRGRIAKVFYPVFPPQENAGDVIAWLRPDGLTGKQADAPPAAVALKSRSARAGLAGDERLSPERRPVIEGRDVVHRALY